METPSPSATSPSISSTEPLRPVVIKVGTAGLIGESGPDESVLARLAEVVAALMGQGRRVVLVTSGAVGTGRWRLGRRPRNIPEKQAAAAIGQGILMHRYDRSFAAHGLLAAQLLVTRADFGERARYLNVTHTLLVLLAHPGVVPVVNENDSVAVEELRFGDNDTLSAMVAGAVDAHCLFILSDVDGLYDADPRKNPAARKLSRVEALTPEIEALAGGSNSGWGTGGMATKLAAARMVTTCGIAMVLMHARDPRGILAVLGGEDVGTTFAPAATRLEGRKRWLAWGGVVSGGVWLDAGAARALREAGRSLLPAGIVEVRGEFAQGDLVALFTADGEEFARGLVNYSAAELRRIGGRKSAEISEILGFKPYDEVVHRNNLVMR